MLSRAGVMEALKSRATLVDTVWPTDLAPPKRFCAWPSTKQADTQFMIFEGNAQRDL